MGIATRIRSLGNVGVYKYALCTNIGDVQCINFNYKDDVNKNKEWTWNLNSIIDCNNLFRNVKGIKIFKGKLPNAQHLKFMFKASYLEEFECDCPKVTITNEQCFGEFNGKFRRFKGELPLLSNGGQMFWYCNGMTTFESELPSLSSGNLMFTSTILNKESAIRILNSIPSYSSGDHPLTIGIHVDHKYDPEVNLALKKADINYKPLNTLPEEVTQGKGWTITVAWNGTKTSNAYPAP